MAMLAACIRCRQDLVTNEINSSFVRWRAILFIASRICFDGKTESYGSSAVLYACYRSWAFRKMWAIALSAWFLMIY